MTNKHGLLIVALLALAGCGEFPTADMFPYESAPLLDSLPQDGKASDLQSVEAPRALHNKPTLALAPTVLSTGQGLFNQARQVQLNLGPSGVSAPPGVEQVSMSNPLGGDDTRVFIGIPRFDSKVKESAQRFFNGTPCWEWTGAITKGNRGGYGQYGIAPAKLHYAHRYAYQQLIGPIPDGLVIDHLCCNRKCVNPAHMEPVTNLENQRRSPNTFAGKQIRRIGQ